MKVIYVIERKDRREWLGRLLESIYYVRKNSTLVDGRVNEFTNEIGNAKAFATEYNAELYMMRHCMPFCGPETYYHIVKYFK